MAIEYDAFGRPTSVQNSLATLSATYDDLGLALSRTTTYSGIAAKTITYSYNPDLSRAAMSLPEDYGITYGYDALGRMTSLTSPLSSNPAQWTYYDNEAVHRRTAPCGAYTDYAYDGKGNLTSLVSKNASNATLSSYGSFTYDAVFNLTSYAASVTGQTSHSGTTEYTYDSLDRLTFEGSEKLGGYEYEFAYDDASNPTTFRNVGSLTYNSSNQKSGTGYAYDGNGNPTTYAGTSLGFDLESRLTAIGSSWSEGYRPDGLRGSKTASSTTTYFLYDGATPVAELNSSGTITALNVFGADGLIGRVVPGGTDIQYLFDHQGNVAQRLNGSGSVISKSTYDAYGAESSTSTPTDPFGYNAQSGYYLDRETGLYLCTYRYYDPAKGRWLNRDPIGYAGGMNLYGYCGGGPVGALDTLGTQAIEFPTDTFGGRLGRSLGLSDNGPSFWRGLDQAAQNSEVPGVWGGQYHAIHGAVTGNSLETVLGIGSVCLEVGLSGLGGEGGFVEAAEGVSVTERVVTEGIYEVITKEGHTYVGQSGNIWRRLLEHVRDGKITREAAESAKRTHVTGGKFHREVAEQGRINELGGVDSPNIANIRNPLGRGRRLLYE